MKKILKISIVASLLATSVYATNGINLIGIGAKSRAMGGVGIATNLNGENGYSNPSMITRTETSIVNLGINYFDSSVSVETPTFTDLGVPNGQVKEDSDYGSNFIPSMAFSTKLNENMFIGINIYGTGGMGVDYTDANNMASGIKDELSIATISIPYAYKYQNLSLGFAPLIKYGTLEMPTITGQNDTSDIGYGFELGLDYEIQGFTIAAVYKSAVDLEYKDVFSSGTNGNETLSTPAVIGLGLSYTIGENTIAFDYKNIGYGDATGLQDFGWENQNVFALGYEYNVKTWAIRAGFNYGDVPFSTDTITNAGSSEASQTFGNLMAFPAVTTTHYTLGGTYIIDGHNSIDVAGVYATGEATADIDADAFGIGSPAGSVTAVNDQLSLSIGYNYNF